MSKQFPCPVTTVFSRRVKPGHEAQYEEWLAGITRASNQFKGNLGSTIIRPQAGHEPYIAILQFDSAEHLEFWMISVERRKWMQKLASVSLESEEVASLNGLERWFTLPNRSVTQAPPHYKSAILVSLGLYPVILLLNPILEPITGAWADELQILVSVLISVPIMIWVVMPMLTRIFFKWLYPEHRASSLTKGQHKG